jgi:RNA polymerase sigma-70 factor (ECF subfamily)
MEIASSECLEATDESRAAERAHRDGDLLASLRRRDEHALEALSDRYGDRTYRLAMRITRSPRDAEEIVQDVLLIAARKIDTLRAAPAFGSWLYRVTANLAYQKVRRQRHRRLEVSWDDLDPCGPPEPGGELRVVLSSALDGLSARDRTIFVLHAVQGLSHLEIAETLRLTPSATKSRVHRSRTRLRQRLAVYANGEC